MLRIFANWDEIPKKTRDFVVDKALIYCFPLVSILLQVNQPRAITILYPICKNLSSIKFFVWFIDIDLVVAYTYDPLSYWLMT